MKNNTQVTQPSNTLLTDLKTIIQTNQEAAKAAANQYLTLTYWQIGHRITNEPNYQSLNLTTIAQELNVERTNIGRSIQLYQTYQDSAPTDLSWSHYRELVTIKNKRTRQTLEQQAINQNWTRDQLTTSIKRQKSTAKTPLSSEALAKDGLKRPTTPTYLYKAKILKIIDGDTLLTLIDLGFQTHKEQRIRLAGIDCPEVDTKEGQEALKFVETTLKKPDFIMIKTNKIDIYGRYIGHIFFDATNQKSKDEIFLEGSYLNQELLNANLAKII